MSGDGAVISNWGAQSPVQGFSGFGQVHLAARCLTGKDSGQQLRWEGCRSGDKAQVWSLSRSTLVNELALCADVEGVQANNVASSASPAAAYRASSGMCTASTMRGVSRRASQSAASVTP